MLMDGMEYYLDTEPMFLEVASTKNIRDLNH